MRWVSRILDRAAAAGAAGSQTAVLRSRRGAAAVARCVPSPCPSWGANMPHAMLQTILALLAPTVLLAITRAQDALADLTHSGAIDGHHDWLLGPTGARGWIWGKDLSMALARQIAVTRVAPGSPADGVLQSGDVILGVGTAPFHCAKTATILDAACRHLLAGATARRLAGLRQRAGLARQRPDRVHRHGEGDRARSWRARPRTRTGAWHVRVAVELRLHVPERVRPRHR